MSLEVHLLFEFRIRCEQSIYSISDLIVSMRKKTREAYWHCRYNEVLCLLSKTIVLEDGWRGDLKTLADLWEQQGNIYFYYLNEFVSSLSFLTLSVLFSYNEAVDAYTKSIEYAPCQLYNYYRRAEAYARLNKHREAINDCKHILTVCPGYYKVTVLLETLENPPPSHIYFIT